METGGIGLFGLRERDGVFAIVIATRLGPGGRRKPNSVLLDYGEVERVARDLDNAGNHDIRLLGSWHTHPSGDGHPSQADRRNALDALGWHDLRVPSFSASLILTASPSRGWSAPVFHAWVTRRNTRGFAITEPASLEGNFR